MKVGKNLILSFAISLSATVTSAPKLAHAQDAAEAEVAAISEQYPAPSPETFGQTQFVLSGNPIVPPRDYSKATILPSKNDYKSNESGSIYDIVFMGVNGGKLQFEIRSFSIDDLEFPATGQTVEFPVDQQKVEIRDLTVSIDEAKAGSLTYTVTPIK